MTEIRELHPIGFSWRYCLWRTDTSIPLTVPRASEGVGDCDEYWDTPSSGSPPWYSAYGPEALVCGGSAFQSYLDSPEILTGAILKEDYYGEAGIFLQVQMYVLTQCPISGIFVQQGEFPVVFDRSFKLKSPSAWNADIDLVASEQVDINTLYKATGSGVFGDYEVTAPCCWRFGFGTVPLRTAVANAWAVSSAPCY